MAGTIAKETEKIYHASLYARLSLESEANRDRNTIETQMQLLHSFVDGTKDIVVEKEYFDISQTGTNFDRPGFDEMIQDMRRGRIDCVIVKDLSRLGRNYVETGNYIERIFPFFSVRFIAVTDGYDSTKMYRGCTAGIPMRSWSIPNPMTGTGRCTLQGIPGRSSWLPGNTSVPTAVIQMVLSSPWTGRSFRRGASTAC